MHLVWVAWTYPLTANSKWVYGTASACNKLQIIEENTSPSLRSEASSKRAQHVTGMEFIQKIIWFKVIVGNISICSWYQRQENHMENSVPSGTHLSSFAMYAGVGLRTSSLTNWFKIRDGMAKMSPCHYMVHSFIRVGLKILTRTNPTTVFVVVILIKFDDLKFQIEVYQIQYKFRSQIRTSKIHRCGLWRIWAYHLSPCRITWDPMAY